METSCSKHSVGITGRMYSPQDKFLGDCPCFLPPEAPDKAQRGGGREPGEPEFPLASSQSTAQAGCFSLWTTYTLVAYDCSHHPCYLEENTHTPLSSSSVPFSLLKGTINLMWRQPDSLTIPWCSGNCQTEQHQNDLQVPSSFQRIFKLSLLFTNCNTFKFRLCWLGQTGRRRAVFATEKWVFGIGQNRGSCF